MVLRRRVLIEKEASCHRPEDVSYSLRGLPTLKESSATPRPRLHTPSTRTEEPLARETTMPSLFLSFPLFLYGFFFRIPLLLFVSRLWRGACDQQPGTRRGLLLAPGTGASALTFRTIRELPASPLRGVAPKTTPGQYPR